VIKGIIRTFAEINFIPSKMKTSIIHYTGALRTTATHLQSGNTLITDAPKDNHGKGEAFSPTDLVATALGSCMISIMGIVAMKNNFVFESGKVEITKIMESAPRRISEVILELTLPGKDLTEQQKEMLKTAALNCPVAKSLHPDVKQTVSFSFV